MSNNRSTIRYEKLAVLCVRAAISLLDGTGQLALPAHVMCRIFRLNEDDFPSSGT